MNQVLTGNREPARGPWAWFRVRSLAGGLAMSVIVGLLSSGSLQAQDEPRISGEYKIEKGTRSGWLIVTVEIPNGSHIYALTQQGNPPPTRLQLAESETVAVLEPFRADKPPVVVEHDPVFEQRVEKHDGGKVRFMAPIRVAEGAGIETLAIDLKFHGQICSETGCKPLFNKPVETRFTGYYVPRKPDDG